MVLCFNSTVLNHQIRHYSKTIRRNFNFNITENIRKALDDGNIGCGVFVDLQKAFDTADHQILVAKFNHYGIRGVSNGWFRSYLPNRSQYAPINEYESGFVAINYGAPQGPVLWPLVHSTSWKFGLCFVYIFIADWNFLTKFCSSDPSSIETFRHTYI